MKLNKALLLIVALCLCANAFAQSSKELKRKKEALQREIELAQKNLNKAASGKKLTLGQINAIKAQIRLRQDKISTINSEMKNLDHQIHENTNKVQNLKGRLADLKKEYAGMIRFAQRNRNSYDKMMFIFAANDFNQAYKRIKYLQQFGQYRKKQAAYIQGTEKQLSNQIVVLDKNLKSKSTLLKEEQNEKTKLDKNRSEQTVVLNKLSKQEKQFQQDIKKKRQQQAAVDRQIQAAIAREIAAARKKAEEEARERERIAAAKAKAENKPTPTTTATTKPKSANEALRSTPEAAKLSDAFEANRGSLPSPVATGYITGRFGAYKVDQATAMRNGVVFQTSEGAAVRAVFNGTVSTVFQQYGRYYVMIIHGEYFTVYEGLQSVSVSKGDKVTTKQTIGAAGTSDGVPELGFQIHRGAVAQNPESWLAR
ncbi:murein hydrolase activator EnvC family protein [Pedobacter xixiisoli]|uniref:Septal ring factor EnvC, activator of murein hydrolases AmiA and AmiB n=1 Tax=Pedobacter xixiisoli TaxID=1476464 RepID=A0A286AEQ8_9SPHI|nr:peptidoglycan DD-metalloendopeptidase family protein [Pedobacter xixiisoli]SOD20379.1 Septal ring factor EnvC, activator of murein hydrolases AmiA and AmiB [Pedobacter xixiisoli]